MEWSRTAADESSGWQSNGGRTMEIITLPKLGISDEGELVAWEVEVGDEVAEGDLLAVFESDKATAEVQATADGVLLETYLDEGDVIPIEPGRPIAVVGDPGEEPPSYQEVAGDDDAATEDDTSTAASTSTATTDDTASEEVKATPRAERYAEEEGVTLAGIEGTGPQGAVTEDDVIAFQEARAEEPDEASAPTAETGSVEEPERIERAERTEGTAPAADTTSTPDTAATDTTDDDSGREGTSRDEPVGDGPTVTERRELSGTRRTIAERLSQSAREKPHVTGTREISIEQAEQLQARLNEADEHEVSLNDILLFAVVRTLEDLPEFNAWYEDGTHQLLSEVNLGYAVDTERGLVVPVLENLHEEDVLGVSEVRQRQVDRVLNNDHTAADLQGGTFTVTNVGVLGMESSYSIINPPEVAILAIGRRKPGAFERDGEIVFERAITFSLTIDHRVLDGADSGAFLDRLNEYLQQPYTLLTRLPMD